MLDSHSEEMPPGTAVNKPANEMPAPARLTSDKFTGDVVRVMQDLIKTDISIVIAGPFPGSCRSRLWGPLKAFAYTFLKMLALNLPTIFFPGELTHRVSPRG